MIRKLRRKNSLKTYRICSEYAIEHIVPRVSGELNGKTIVYKTASGINPQKIHRFRHVNHRKACKMVMFFRPKNKIKRKSYLIEYGII